MALFHSHWKKTNKYTVCLWKVTQMSPVRIDENFKETDQKFSRKYRKIITHTALICPRNRGLHQ